MRLQHLKSIESVRTELASMEDGLVQAQELVQKGAMDALTKLLRIGCTESNARAMLDSLGQYGEAISAECKKRGLATISDPRGH